MRTLATLFAFTFLLSVATAQGTHDAGGKTIKVNAAQLQLVVNVEVATTDPGLVEVITIKEGDTINEGDVIARLDRDAAEATVRTAASELEIAIEESRNDVDLQYAKVSKEVSNKVYQRSLNSVKQFAKSVSQTELEKLKLEVERARLSGEQAERTGVINGLTVDLKKAQLDLAEVQLEKRTIKSPVSGLVVQVYRQVGESVQSNETVARIIDLKRLRVSCRCYLKDASPDSLAKEATFIHDGNEYKAKVVFASPEIDPDVQDFIVWAEVENPDGVLKPGMRGSMQLKTRD